MVTLTTSAEKVQPLTVVVFRFQAPIFCQYQPKKNYYDPSLLLFMFRFEGLPGREGGRHSQVFRSVNLRRAHAHSSANLSRDRAHSSANLRRACTLINLRRACAHS